MSGEGMADIWKGTEWRPGASQVSARKEAGETAGSEASRQEHSFVLLKKNKKTSVIEDHYISRKRVGAEVGGTGVGEGLHCIGPYWCALSLPWGSLAGSTSWNTYVLPHPLPRPHLSSGRRADFFICRPQSLWSWKKGELLRAKGEGQIDCRTGPGALRVRDQATITKDGRAPSKSNE